MVRLEDQVRTLAAKKEMLLVNNQEIIKMNSFDSLSTIEEICKSFR